ncbi:hypothetical protein PhaeoP128_02715 [Phaeobacter gallaeciensis]|nr:hypothetical protein PhaeoP129_02714 [Phaeobacter gallaeciensis]ATF23433.1 hypothetical protein PhaeoP128_02715 [Phaeobacter gallaeciensis]
MSITADYVGSGISGRRCRLWPRPYPVVRKEKDRRSRHATQGWVAARTASLAIPPENQGMMTVSMMWITPFSASISAAVTVASSTITPLSRSMVTSLP